MVTSVDVAVIGAGPYGLSVAAHLAGRGIDHRVFGEPMQLWRQNMPPGMMLKSDGKSSNLSDPQGAFPLAEFCRMRKLDYHRALTPVTLETFTAYGFAFQERFAPRVERRQLVRLERSDRQFELYFDDGEWLTAKRVILAIGVLPFRHVPEPFAALPPELASHSSEFGPLERLDGRDVAILGAGSSALDLAALLQHRGTRVTLVTRAQQPVFHSPPPAQRSLPQRLRSPDSKIGGGWLHRLYDDAPHVVHALPASLRRRIMRTTLGPSGGYFIRDQVVGKVAMKCGRSVLSVTERAGKVQLQTQDRDGGRETVEADHLILATGYRAEMARLGFLSPAMLQRLGPAGSMLPLSADYESPVPGLYFVGFASLAAFGPVMRFVAGAPHPAQRLARHLATLRQPGFAPAPLKATG